MWSQLFLFLSPLPSVHGCTLTKAALVAHRKIDCSTVLHSQVRTPARSCVLCVMVEVKGLIRVSYAEITKM